MDCLDKVKKMMSTKFVSINLAHLFLHVIAIEMMMMMVVVVMAVVVA